MKIGVGYELLYHFPQPTPMLLMLNVHYSRAGDILIPDIMTTTPAVPISGYRDGFGNWCTRLVAPAGQIRIAGAGTLLDAGLPDPTAPGAWQHEVQDLPEDALVYLLGSRYCETDELTNIAWSLFGHTPPGWARVQAVCDFVHNHIVFNYEHARPTKTAFQAYNERQGVCRDYAHLAVAFCRCPETSRRATAPAISAISAKPAHSRRWIRRLVRGLSRRCLAHVRPAQQQAPHGPGPHRPRPRRHRCGDHQHVWPEHAEQVHGVDPRGYLDAV